MVLDFFIPRLALTGDEFSLPYNVLIPAYNPTLICDMTQKQIRGHIPYKTFNDCTPLSDA